MIRLYTSAREESRYQYGHLSSEGGNFTKSFFRLLFAFLLKVPLVNLVTHAFQRTISYWRVNETDIYEALVDNDRSTILHIKRLGIADQKIIDIWRRNFRHNDVSQNNICRWIQEGIIQGDIVEILKEARPNNFPMLYAFFRQKIILSEEKQQSVSSLFQGQEWLQQARRKFREILTADSLSQTALQPFYNMGYTRVTLLAWCPNDDLEKFIAIENFTKWCQLNSQFTYTDNSSIALYKKNCFENMIKQGDFEEAVTLFKEIDVALPRPAEIDAEQTFAFLSTLCQRHPEICLKCDSSWDFLLKNDEGQYIFTFVEGVRGTGNLFGKIFRDLYQRYHSVDKVLVFLKGQDVKEMSFWNHLFYWCASMEQNVFDQWVERATTLGTEDLKVETLKLFELLLELDIKACGSNALQIILAQKHVPIGLEDVLEKIDCEEEQAMKKVCASLYASPEFIGPAIKLLKNKSEFLKILRETVFLRDPDFWIGIFKKTLANEKEIAQEILACIDVIVYRSRGPTLRKWLLQKFMHVVSVEELIAASRLDSILFRTFFHYHCLDLPRLKLQSLVTHAKQQSTDNPCLLHTLRTKILECAPDPALWLELAMKNETDQKKIIHEKQICFSIMILRNLEYRDTLQMEKLLWHMNTEEIQACVAYVIENIPTARRQDMHLGCEKERLSPFEMRRVCFHIIMRYVYFDQREMRIAELMQSISDEELLHMFKNDLEVFNELFGMYTCLPAPAIQSLVALAQNSPEAPADLLNSLRKKIFMQNPREWFALFTACTTDSQEIIREKQICFAMIVRLIKGEYDYDIRRMIRNIGTEELKEFLAYVIANDAAILEILGFSDEIPPSLDLFEERRICFSIIMRHVDTGCEDRITELMQNIDSEEIIRIFENDQMYFQQLCSMLLCLPDSALQGLVAHARQLSPDLTLLNLLRERIAVKNPSKWFEIFITGEMDSAEISREKEICFPIIMQCPKNDNLTKEVIESIDFERLIQIFAENQDPHFQQMTLEKIFKIKPGHFRQMPQNRREEEIATWLQRAQNSDPRALIDHFAMMFGQEEESNFSSFQKMISGILGKWEQIGAPNQLKNPVEFAEYFRAMENKLRIIAYRYPELPQDEQRIALIELLHGAKRCPTGQAHAIEWTVQHVLGMLGRQNAGNFKEKTCEIMDAWLHDVKTQLLSRELQQAGADRVGMEVHYANYIAKVLDEQREVSATQEERSETLIQGSEGARNKIVERFDRLYSPFAMVKRIEEAMRDDQQYSASVYEWASGVAGRWDNPILQEMGSKDITPQERKQHYQKLAIATAVLYEAYLDSDGNLDIRTMRRDAFMHIHFPPDNKYAPSLMIIVQLLIEMGIIETEFSKMSPLAFCMS